jgi:hypothetical protein
MRSETASCAGVADRLAEAAASHLALGAAERDHVEHCLRCQAEVAQYRKLLRGLGALRAEIYEPGPGLVADVLAAVEAARERRAARALLRGRRVAYVGGIAAATAAAGGALVLASRSRRRVHLAS